MLFCFHFNIHKRFVGGSETFILFTLRATIVHLFHFLWASYWIFIPQDAKQNYKSVHSTKTNNKNLCSFLTEIMAFAPSLGFSKMNEFQTNFDTYDYHCIFCSISAYVYMFTVYSSSIYFCYFVYIFTSSYLFNLC